jgi:tRNA G37 N-methylase TrmD
MNIIGNRRFEVEVKENHKSWTKDQWAGRKDSLRTCIQDRINELGIDNELRVPDFVLASSMVESMTMISVAYRLRKQVIIGNKEVSWIAE